MSLKKMSKNQNGQMILEMILIMAALFIATVLLSQQMKSNGYVSSLVQGPWKRLAGMIESGSWAEAKDARALHPNHRTRHVSYYGDEDL